MVDLWEQNSIQRSLQILETEKEHIASGCAAPMRGLLHTCYSNPASNFSRCVYSSSRFGNRELSEMSSSA